MKKLTHPIYNTPTLRIQHIDSFWIKICLQNNRTNFDREKQYGIHKYLPTYSAKTQTSPVQWLPMTKKHIFHGNIWQKCPTSFLVLFGNHFFQKKKNVTHIDSHVTAWGDRCLCGLGVKIYQTSGFCRCIGGTWKCPSDAKKKKLMTSWWLSFHPSEKYATSSNWIMKPKGSG